MGEPLDPHAAPPPGEEPAYYPPPPFTPQPYRYGPPAEYGPPPEYGPPAQYGPPPEYGPPPASPYGVRPELVAATPPWGVEDPFGQMRRGRRRRFVTINAALALVLGGLATGGFLLFTSGSSNPAQPAVPETFDGYTRLHNDQAQRLETAARSLANSASGGAGAIVLSRSTVAIYAKDTGDIPSLFAIVMPRSVAAGQLPGQTDDTIVAQMVRLTTDGQSYPSGSRGGSLECGDVPFATTSETICAWADQSRIGVIVSAPPGLDPASLAVVANDFRATLH